MEFEVPQRSILRLNILLGDVGYTLIKWPNLVATLGNLYLCSVWLGGITLSIRMMRELSY